MKVVSLMLIARTLNIIPQTLHHFITHNGIPTLQRKPKLLMDLDSNHPFLISTKHALAYNCNIFYTIPDIANLLEIDRKTAIKYLHSFDVPIQNQHHPGSRAYVYFTDFLFMLKRQDNLSLDFMKRMEKYKDARRSKTAEKIHKKTTRKTK